MSLFGYMVGVCAERFGNEEAAKLAIRLMASDSFGKMEDGGAGSGNWGHRGRPGMVGGSGKGGEEKAKMAAEAGSNDWSKTKARNVSREEKDSLIRYAKEKGIRVVTMKAFDGDSTLFKSVVDKLSEQAQKYMPLLKNKLTLCVREMDDDDFAEADGKYAININSLALRDRKATENNIQNNGYFASQTAEDIVEHELWHLIAERIGNKAFDIGREAYYNVYGQVPSKDQLIDLVGKTVSENAATYIKSGSDSHFSVRYLEVMPEVIVKQKYTKDSFVIEFSNLIRRKADEKL